MVNFSQILFDGGVFTEVDIENYFLEVNHQQSDFSEFIESLLGTPYWKNAEDQQGNYRLACRIFSVAVDGYAKSIIKEPPYHSRSHFKDVCLGVSILLLNQPEDMSSGSRLKNEDVWILLLSAIGHDFGHNGAVNSYPFEIELRSIEYINQLLMASELPISFTNRLIDRMRPIILATEPTCLKVALDTFIKDQDSKTFSLVNYMSVLMIEADLMASTLPAYGEILTQKLSNEWMMENPENAIFITTRKGRLNFLNSFQFVSPPAQHIGLETMRKKIVGRLKALIKGGVS